MMQEIEIPSPMVSASEPSIGVRDRLVEVAARHFADHGLQGASQRAIQREVGVNNSTSNYYFGSKDALYRAVLEAALTPLQREREAALDDIPQRLSAAERLRALLTAYIAPHIRRATTELGRNYARMIAGLHHTVPDAALEVLEEWVTPVRERYVDALTKLFPDASRNRIYEALRLAVALMAFAAIRQEHLSPAEAERLIRQIVTVSAIAFETLCGASSE